MPGKKNVERIVADANVLLSAVIGKAALRVFTRSNIQIVTTATALDEVREYLPTMAANYGIAREILEAQFRLLPVKAFPEKEFKNFIPEAHRLIGKRDPDDVHLLALALALNVPLWTNDRDFEKTGVETCTTARLLKQLDL